MKNIFLALLLVAVPAGAADTSKNDTEDERDRLYGKWIVRSIALDGEPTPAQIGQKVGDVITIQKDGASILLL